MGFYTQYLSTILKGKWTTSIKERIEARRAIYNLSEADKKIYQKLPELVDKEHRVTAANKDEDKVIKALKKAAANSYALAFNVSTMDMAILEAVDGLIKVISKIHELGKTLKGSDIEKKIEQLSQLFVQLMQKAIKKAKQEERWEYKYVEIIVNEAIPGRNHKQLMSVVRTMFQTLGRQSRLAKFPIRMEIGRERRDIIGINRLTTQCKNLLETIPKNLKSRKHHENALYRLVSELEQIIQEGAKYVEDAFYEAYLIKKRDFMLILKIIVNVEVLRGMNRKWVMMHFMPSELVKRKNIQLDEIEEKISKEFHTIAQALRISMVQIERLDAEVARV